MDQRDCVLRSMRDSLLKAGAEGGRAYAQPLLMYHYHLLKL